MPTLIENVTAFFAAFPEDQSRSCHTAVVHTQH